MRIDIARAAELLRENDDILVLCHAHPDGDTLGCGYALMHMLQSLGKRCRLECADEIAPKYSFMAKGLEIFGDFEPKFITTVDVADIKLLSDESAEKYSGRVDLCIDHLEHRRGAGGLRGLHRCGLCGDTLSARR